jgi:YVTN family beta-propeller protein
MRRVLAVLCAGVAAAGCAEVAASASAPRATRAHQASSGKATVYVANFGSGTVTPVAAATGKAGRPITLARHPDTAHPTGIVGTPDGSTLYAVTGGKVVFDVRTATRSVSRIVLPDVATFIGMLPDGHTAYAGNWHANAVTPISTSTGKAGKPIHVGPEPFAIGFAPNSESAYVVDEGAGIVVPITTAVNKARAPIHVGRLPVAVVISPNSRTGYVANFGSGTVTPFSTATGKTRAAIAVAKNAAVVSPEAIAITPNGSTLYVAAGISSTRHGSLKSYVVPIGTATGTAGLPIAVPVKGSMSLAITPNGHSVYVVGNGAAGYAAAAISTVTNTLIAMVPIPGSSDALAVSPDGRLVYVLDSRANTVTVISTATNTARRPVKVGKYPVALAISR